MHPDSPRDELTWPATWTDRTGRDRTPSIPGHELAGVVIAAGYGTTGLSIGQRVFGLTGWYRDGTLAEYVAVDARNLAPLPGDVDFTTGAALVRPGVQDGPIEWQMLRAVVWVNCRKGGLSKTAFDVPPKRLSGSRENLLLFQQSWPSLGLRLQSQGHLGEAECHL